MDLLLVEMSGEMEFLAKATTALPQRKPILIGLRESSERNKQSS